MKKISPLLKGVITGAAMLVLTLIIYYNNIPPESGISFLIYAVYAAGIIWTIISHSRSAAYTGKFGDLFSQGFRCYIIVTLIMVLFTAGFSMSHPEFAEQDAKLYKEYLDKEVKDKTPAEKEEMVANAKKQYTTKLIYSSVFGYLFIGTLFTAAAGGGLLLLRRKI